MSSQNRAKVYVADQIAKLVLAFKRGDRNVEKEHPGVNTAEFLDELLRIEDMLRREVK